MAPGRCAFAKEREQHCKLANMLPAVPRVPVTVKQILVGIQEWFDVRTCAAAWLLVE